MPIPVLLAPGQDSCEAVKTSYLFTPSQSGRSTLWTPDDTLSSRVPDTDSFCDGAPNAIYAKRGPFQFSAHRNAERMFPYYADNPPSEGEQPSSAPRRASPIRWDASRNMPLWGAVTPGPVRGARTAPEASVGCAADLSDRYRRVRETGHYTVSTAERSTSVGFGGLSLLYRQARAPVFRQQTPLARQNVDV